MTRILFLNSFRIILVVLIREALNRHILIHTVAISDVEGLTGYEVFFRFARPILNQQDSRVGKLQHEGSHTRLLYFVVFAVLFHSFGQFAAGASYVSDAASQALDHIDLSVRIAP